MIWLGEERWSSRVSWLTVQQCLRSGPKTQKEVWAFGDKSKRGTSHVRPPAGSQIDSQSNKRAQKAPQSKKCESAVSGWTTFPHWSAVMLLLPFTRTVVHLKEKPLSSSTISLLQRCTCWLMVPVDLFFTFYFPFTYSCSGVCDILWANARSQQKTPLKSKILSTAAATMTKEHQNFRTTEFVHSKKLK